MSLLNLNGLNFVQEVVGNKVVLEKNNLICKICGSNVSFKTYS